MGKLVGVIIIQEPRSAISVHRNDSRRQSSGHHYGPTLPFKEQGRGYKRKNLAHRLVGLLSTSRTSETVSRICDTSKRILKRIQHRPLQWSSSSVIFSAHTTEALVTGRHFSSSKQFTLPSPTPIVASPPLYDPPTTITVSPTEKWLFAYFPRRDGEGIGCIWQRGNQIDTWAVKESWNYPRNGGVVAASWIGHHREVCSRLPVLILCFLY